MTIGIYCIRHIESGKRYIGKSIDIERRWKKHRSGSDNRHLRNAIRKHGINSYHFLILEKFDVIDDDMLSRREMFWIEHFQTCDRKFGYNLESVSEGSVIVHAETRLSQSVAALLRDPPTAATRAKMSAGIKASCTKPAVRAKRATDTRAAWAKPGVKEARVRRHRDVFSDPEKREKMSANRRSEWAVPEIRARRLETLRATRATPESRLKTSRASKDVHARRRAHKALVLWVTSV